MTAPCQACGEDPDLGAMCPVAGLRHVTAQGIAADEPQKCGYCVDGARPRTPWCPHDAVPPSPEEMATIRWPAWKNRGAPPMYRLGAEDERSRSAAETAALHEENARLRAALHEAEQTRDGALYRARLLSERMLREKR